MKNIVIIGNGVAGTTAARHIRKQSNHRITIIGEETRHFYSRTALMYIYMGHMSFEDTKPYEDWFWQKNSIDLIHSRVVSIDTERKSLTLQNEQIVHYDQLILATGSCPNRFDWPGQNLRGVQGLYHLQDLQLMENNTAGISRGVIVGGGLIGIEMAEMLLSRGIEVTMLVREPCYWGNVLPAGESEMIADHIREHHVDLRLETELREIKGDDTGGVTSVVTTNGESIECQFVGLTVGVHPNISLCAGTDIETARGILVNEFLETSVKGVFAVGDCVEHRTPPAGRRPVEQVWYTGKIMGETLASTLCSEKTSYEPGIWFNSAKFFDVEYQTYGDVPASTPDGVKSFFWRHPEKQICVRLNFSEESGKFLGVNLFGVRGRHQVFEHWISSGASVEEVVANLQAANFDPEFFRLFEQEIVQAFNHKFDLNLELTSRKGLFSSLFTRGGVNA